MVDYVTEMTSKMSCMSGKYGFFLKRFLFLFCFGLFLLYLFSHHLGLLMLFVCLLLHVRLPIFQSPLEMIK